MFDSVQQHEEEVERLLVPLRRSNHPPYPYYVVRPPSSLPQHQGYFRSWNATTTTRIIDIYPRLNGPYTLYHLQCISSRKKRNRTRWMTTTTNISTAFPTFTRILLQPQSLQTTTTTTTTKTTTQPPQMFHSILSFLPDFTEHPKPKKHKPKPPPVPPPPSDDGSNGTGSNDNNDDSNNNNNDITFLHDFIAGGVAGSASVIVGHPFDTIKVRLQTSTNATTGILASISEFGGVTSLFRGMTAPLGAAAIINAIVFGSYGFSSRLYDKFITIPALDATDADAEEVSLALTHDPWQKSLSCGAFAGFVQCFVICPLEHIKCRLQIQPKKSKKPVTNTLTKTPPGTIPSPPTSIPEYYNGPIDAVRKIATQHGIHRLYQGWCSTLLREVPAFGLYFCTYDYLKDVTNTLLIQYWKDDTSSTNTTTNMTPHTWIASAIAGGLSGSLTWAIVYPVDLIKSHIQTRSLTTPYTQLRLFHVGRSIVQQHGVKYLFRGLNITLIRALPVNGTIFPVYEFTLKQITLMGY